MSYFLRKNSRKTLFFLYFRHFFPKKFKKSAIFVQSIFEWKMLVEPAFGPYVREFHVV